LVEAVLEGARSKGAETQVFYLGELDVNPCRVCNSCKSTGKCAQDDDMQPIYRALDKTDAIVFGTPVYHDHVSAQSKIVTDRLYSYEWKDSFPERVKVVVVVTYEWDNPRGYDHVIEWIKATFKRYYKAETVAVLKAYGTSKRPVAQSPALLAEAQAAGACLP